MYNYVQLCEGVYLPFSASFFDFLVFFRGPLKNMKTHVSVSCDIVKDFR